MNCGLSSAQIVSDFNIDRDIIFKEFSATVTVTLTNPALYKSISVSHGFSIPSSVSGSCAVTGGDGSLYLEEPNETAHYILKHWKPGEMFKQLYISCL